MIHKKEPLYTIPAKYRRMENMHIVFWLFKDISWCILWRELGIVMLLPTLLLAIVISWQNRNIKAELAHNLAITLWITANGYWMISEFFNFDETLVWGNFRGKHFALIPFITGVSVLLYYYAVQRPRALKENSVVTL